MVHIKMRLKIVITYVNLNLLLGLLCYIDCKFTIVRRMALQLLASQVNTTQSQ
jgi:hypothetical protein